MSIVSQFFYAVKCDQCGYTDTDSEYTWWGDEGHALDVALDSDWTTDGVKHHCPECPGLSKCERCDKPAGDLAGERDYHCQTCWDALEAAELAAASRLKETHGND